MTTLTDLKRLALAAIDALERTRRGELDQMALLDARSVELVAVHGKCVLAMIAVIAAAKAYFGQGDELEAEAAFHEALAKLEQQT